MTHENKIANIIERYGKPIETDFAIHNDFRNLEVPTEFKYL